MEVGTGQVMFFDQSLLRALLGNLSVSVQAGSIQAAQDTHLDAKVQTLVQTQAGEINLLDNATLSADDTVTVRITAKGAASGGLTMEDAETLIQAGQRVEIDTYSDVKMDLIRSGNQVAITSHQGAILDNTAAETDLIFGTTLSMSAFSGIGQPWTNNLNLNVSEINAFNSYSNGINIQNRPGFKVGDQGIANIGRVGVSDVAVTSGGGIDYLSQNYRGGLGAPGVLSTQANYRMYVIANMTPSALDL